MFNIRLKKEFSEYHIYTVLCMVLLYPLRTFSINDINWENYMASHDIIYTEMPDNYYDGVYVGNGLLGTIIFGESKDKGKNIFFEIGRSDVYDHRPEPFAVETKTWPKTRLPIGRLVLSTKGKIDSTYFRIDLWNAEIKANIRTDLGTVEFSCFVPSQENVIVVMISKIDGDEDVNVNFVPQQGNCSRSYLRPTKGQCYVSNPPFYEERTSNGINVVTQPLLAGKDSKVIWNDLEWIIANNTRTDLCGDDYATAWTELDRKESKLIYLTVANRWAEKIIPSYNSKYDAINIIEDVKKKSIDEMIKVHRNWWHEYYKKSFLTFPDKKLESYFWIQMYRLASAGQIGKPVIDLMGPWYKPTVWPSLWLNLNAQLTYSIWGVTNHLDLEDEFYKLLDRHSDELKYNVPKDFQEQCSAIRNPVGFDDLSGSVFMTKDSLCSEPMNLIVLPWWVHMYYIHNKRTMDLDRLEKKLYPLMKRTFAVYKSILYKGGDGKYHLPLTFSDEYGNDYDVNMNLALAKWGFKTLIECAKLLKCDYNLIGEWQDFLDNMVDYQIDDNGYRIGRNYSFYRPHRHFSHLFNIFPLYEIDIDFNPELKDLMYKSISHYVERDSKIVGENCMYKYAGGASLWASVGEGDKALECIKRSILIYNDNRPSATSNGFYSETGWPTFESPIATCRAIIDLMLQSHNGIIRIFPAMPFAWKDASFYKYRAEGGFIVSATRENGRTKFIKIESLAGAKCKIKVDWDNDVKLGYKSDQKNVVLKRNGQFIDINLEKGKNIVLFNEGDNPSSWKMFPQQTVGQNNYWGSKAKSDSL